MQAKPETLARTAPPPMRAHREAAPFALLAEGNARGIPGALVTICGIDGGAPKPLGTHMAVLADGRHVGHISGGCVEAAVAAEVVPLIGAAADQIIRFGKGSCFIDIRFPCGGGVDLLVHGRPDPAMVAEALARLEAREAFSIGFDVPRSTAKLSPDAGRQTGLDDGVLHRRYLPRTRLLLAGRGPDFETVARVAAAAEFEVAVLSPDEDSLNALADLGGTRMTAPGAPPDLPIDPWTATVLMFHEHEWENALLARAAAAPGFYVGALGSVRTHRERVERLRAMGVPDADIARIKGPIGLIDRARDPGTLALSILAEVSAARAALDRT